MFELLRKAVVLGLGAIDLSEKKLEQLKKKVEKE